MTDELFSFYSFHMQQLEDVVDKIATGDTIVSTLKEVSDDDISYIKNRLKEKYNINIEIYRR